MTDDGYFPPHPTRPVAHGRFQLLSYGGGRWINEGDDNGRGCRFATREDAEAWAEHENKFNRDGDGVFAVIELPLPLAPVSRTAVEDALAAMRQVIDTGALKTAPAHLNQAHVDCMRADLHEAIRLLAKETSR